jgi:hypothetical protein
MNKHQGFLATFRIDQSLWEKFKAIAKSSRTNASALLLGYIEGVVGAGGLDDFGILPIQQAESLSLQDIDKYIDEKIKLLSIQQAESLSLQDIDKHIDEKIKLLSIQQAESLSLQDIDKHIDERLGGISQLIRNEIGNSLNEGDIAAKLERNRENVVNHLNEINDRLVKVEGVAVGENKLAIPTIKKAEPTNTKTEPTDDDKAYIISVLGIQKILNGEEKYSKNSRKLFDLVVEHKVNIESKLGIKIGDMAKYPVRGFNAILEALGYKNDFKQPIINGTRVSEYFVVKGTI